MNHIELFAGCGGLSLGLESAGFDLLLANELSPMAAETFAYNHLNADLPSGKNVEKILWISSSFPRSQMTSRLRENPEEATGLGEHHFSDLLELEPKIEELKRSLLVGSIIDLNKILAQATKKTPTSLLKLFQSGFGSGEVDLVSGGPPCQSFSLAGMRQHSHRRNRLPGEFAKFVQLVKPKLVLLENVSGILRPFKVGEKKKFAWFEVAKAFAREGYLPLCLHVNAKYVGAAQNRPRFIMIAVRKDIYLKYKKNSRNNDPLIDAFKGSETLIKELKKGNASYGCLEYFDINKYDSLFRNSLLSPLVSHKDPDASDNLLVSVKDAIDDLREGSVSTSDYVHRLNNIFERHENQPTNKHKNHELRANSGRVRSRFRIYQIMNSLDKAEAKEVSNFLRTDGQSGICKPTLSAVSKFWLLGLDGIVIKKPSQDGVLRILKELYTKKQTQKALIANAPAPAALSVADDACHYHESKSSLRTLTVREMARIQSFPDWYELRSKVTTGGQMRRFEVPQYTQVGNAVPPLLGLALGQVCRAFIEKANGS